MRIKLKYVFIVIATALFCSGNASAQKRRNATQNPVQPTFIQPRTTQADSLMNAYLFEEAKDIIAGDIEQATAVGYPTSQLKANLQKAIIGIRMLEATERVVVVDSFVVDRQQMLQTIMLDVNCGKILTAQQAKDVLGMKQLPAGVSYINSFGDHIIFSSVGKGGTAALMSSNRFGNTWSKPHILEGLQDSSAVQGYPYLLSDGTTFYFASKTSSSLGGYDIYTTRYSSDTKNYLKPENVGMPFNSPYNDYLMVVDDVNQLGWFVSDRYQPADKVCVYVFIPTRTRETYDNVNKDSLRTIAALRSIKVTQQGYEKDVADARQRLVQTRSNKTTASMSDEICFDVAYGVRYTNINQFRTAEARKLASEHSLLYKKRNQLYRLLNENRQKYGESQSPTEKKTLTPMILRQEKEIEDIDLQIIELANKTRQAEMPESNK